jgi:hypothetical protein
MNEGGDKERETKDADPIKDTDELGLPIIPTGDP